MNDKLISNKPWLICFSKTQNLLKSLSYIQNKQVVLVAYLVG
jgi:hypothetical protein